MVRRIVALGLVAAIAFAGVGCGGTDDVVPEQPVASTLSATSTAATLRRANGTA